MGSKLDKTKDGQPTPDSPDHPDLPAPPAPADQRQRQQLEDRLAAAQDTDPSMPKLRERAKHLPPGSPSSPYAEDGTLRPPEPSLKEIELPEPPLTDAQWAEHRQEVADRLDKAVADGISTNRTLTISRDRDIWTDDRAAIHDQIIDDFYLAAADVPCEGLAIIAGGLPGAGKTTVLEQQAGINRANYLTINPDSFKDELARRGLVPKVSGLTPMEASALVHEESSYMARQLALRAMAERKNVIWDVTMSSLSSTATRINNFRSAGYRSVDGLFVDIPNEVSVARAEARHRRGHDLYLAGTELGGRCVPPNAILAQADPEYGSINRRNFEQLKDKFDHWRVYENSVDGRPAILMEEGPA